jgi:acyl-CoA dehydrogenase
LHTLRTAGFGAARTRSRAKITDRCLQLFGGYGYMEQYHPISRMYGDARVTRIYVRTNEFMKAPIARSL